MTSATTTVTIRHNFETAHRLPHLGGKCTNLHGHSWWADITVDGELDDRGILVDFGALKRHVRDWIDSHLDHGAMLGADDPLHAAITDDGSKVFTFGADLLADDLAWPTVENVALLLQRATTNIIARENWPATCTRVRVTETHVNAAEVTT